MAPPGLLQSLVATPSGLLLSVVASPIVSRYDASCVADYLRAWWRPLAAGTHVRVRRHRVLSLERERLSAGVHDGGNRRLRPVGDGRSLGRGLEGERCKDYHRVGRDWEGMGGGRGDGAGREGGQVRGGGDGSEVRGHGETLKK